MATSKFFQFTLSPVQGFVAQARRTRDFWAGSFLLSWLVGVAMAEVKRQGGAISFPKPPDDYLSWITTGKGQGQGPRQGAIPNRFKAYQFEVPADFDAAWVAICVREAWSKLAEHVWQQDQLAELATPLTRRIWERQHSGFWDISWVITDDHNDGDSSLMDQRKNWRSHYNTSGEPGVKCMVMEGWQELSGSTQPGQAGDAFWRAVRADKRTDLGEGEQLCALAYVKRRFVRHFASFSAQLNSGLSVYGWKLSAGMPSVSYMAAVHWLERLIQTASADEAWQLLAAAGAVNDTRDEWDTHILCLKTAAGAWAKDNEKRQLLALDGNLFFEHVQANPRANDFDVLKMRLLQKELAHFRRKHPKFPSYPSPFYAILLMDGDSLGVHMSDKDKQTKISESLEQFTRNVPAVVDAHNGCLIYAGGDDVLAILPLEDAMPCALAVRKLYTSNFAGKNIPTTISAAIEYAHVKLPLGKILADSHDLLDNVAKDGSGRDALAVRVWKPGGMALQWAQPWDIAVQGNMLEIEAIAKKFASSDEKLSDANAGRFSSKFFFKISDRFDLLNPTQETKTSVLNKEDALDLLAVDYLHSAEHRQDLTLAHARAEIKPLLKQCRAVKRLPEKPQAEWKTSPMLLADGALLVRFLAQKGIDE